MLLIIYGYNACDFHICIDQQFTVDYWSALRIVSRRTDNECTFTNRNGYWEALICAKPTLLFSPSGVAGRAAVRVLHVNRLIISFVPSPDHDFLASNLAPGHT